MAGFTDTLRGDGLARAQRALAGLEGNPQRLDHERIRFDSSPPPYISDRSGTTTRSQSPNPPNEEQRRRQERRVQLGRERIASQPYNQFSAQTSEERDRLLEASLNGIRRLPVGSNTYKMARENVKKRWVEQGIWNNKWNEMASGRWKHEEPPELESESKTDSEAESPPLFSFLPEQPQPKPRRPKSDNEKRRIAERRAVRESEREASRPYRQFVYQISKERERIQEKPENGEGADAADINTRAYENVKNTWTKRGIWNGRWGILPGMSWKHEEPLEEETADGPAPQANPVENGSHEVEGAPLRNIFGRPVTNLSESGIFDRNPSPAETNNRQACGAMNPSQHGPPADVDATGLENDDAERSPSAPNSSPLRTGKLVPRPTTGQVSRSSRRKPTRKEGQPQPVASASLGPVHSSKVSKGALKKKPGPQRRPRISEHISSDGV
jgi:hypothetical protein